MAYPLTPKLQFPLVRYKVNSHPFKQECTYDDKYWGLHLGEDVNTKEGTAVRTIGLGKVVYSALHPGTREHGNWGNIIIIAHKNPKTKKRFFSLYAHLNHRMVQKGDSVTQDQLIGDIGKANTPENGWWKEAHLHFAIYTGLWKGKVLPGYYKKGSKQTRLSYWENPTKFIQTYKV